MITYASILADQRVAELLSGNIEMTLADRNALPNHPALIYAGDTFGASSQTFKVSFVGLDGAALLVAIGDGASLANTALVDSSVTVSVGRYGKMYEVTDGARNTNGPGGAINPQKFAEDAVVAAAMTKTSLIANVVDDFTAYVGTSGASMTIANFLGAANVLELANVLGPFLAMLSPRQAHDLKIALTTAGGGVQWMPRTQEQLNVLGNGYRGNWGGIDIFSSNQIPTKNAGADWGGGMFGRGAIIWADSSQTTDGDPNQVVLNGKVKFERDRQAPANTTRYVTRAELGVVRGLDAAGCSIITDY